ncbi:hypothetical protein CDCA_CDCA06G2001 [Cyanidium caldarium]|uniref:Enhancer of mRNA-decapping protein 4 C-terminal domain-containing protein n=1 Tax=Cyanidium caldarium TaxID=2771 RepID=A0AAV9IV93_CYACA|nr:hypothetical protein CDCA_CDCA06G2001 [Cyanidium caldarium]
MDDAERLAMQRRALTERFGLEVEEEGDVPEAPGRPGPTTTVWGRWGRREGKSGTQGEGGDSFISTVRENGHGGEGEGGGGGAGAVPSVVVLEPEDAFASRENGLEIRARYFEYDPARHAHARSRRELSTVTPVTVYASPYVESTSRRIAVDAHVITYAVKSHIRCIARQSGERALLKGHSGDVVDMVMPQAPLDAPSTASPPGVLLSAAADGSVYLWRVECAPAASDGADMALLAAALWHTQTQTREPHASAVRVAIAPDATHLAYTDADAVWLQRYDRQQRQVRGEGVRVPVLPRVTDLCWVSPSEEGGGEWRLLIGTADGTLLVVEVASGRLQHSFPKVQDGAIERVLAVRDGVFGTASTACRVLHLWRLPLMAFDSSSGSSNQLEHLAQLSLQAVGGYFHLATDPSGEWVFMANVPRKRLFIVHLGAAAATEGGTAAAAVPDFLVELPTRQSILSCSVTRTESHERDVDAASGLPQMVQEVQLDLWCVHEKSIQAYHVLRRDLLPAADAAADDDHGGSSPPPSHPSASPSGDLAGRRQEASSRSMSPASTSTSSAPLRMNMQTHELYETFHRQQQQQQQQQQQTQALPRLPMPPPNASPGGGVMVLSPRLNDEAMGRWEARLDTLTGAVQHLVERVERWGDSEPQASSEAAVTRALQAVIAERLVPALDRALRDVAGSLSEALDASVARHAQWLWQQWREHGASAMYGMGEYRQTAASNTRDPAIAPPAIPASPREQIRQQLAAAPPQLDRAFHLALCASDLPLLLWLCGQCEPEAVCDQLSQPVLLSLAQQLSFDLRADTECKLRYLEEALSLIDPQDAIIREHVPATMQQLVQNVDAQVLSSTASGIEAGWKSRARMLRKLAVLLRAPK